MKRDLTFDNFHIYEGNKVAFLAVKKILEFPGELFNPLYLYGGTGLGKTHILWALQSVMAEKGTVDFYTGKDFEQQLLQGTVFKNPLIVDDIHLIDVSCHDKLGSIIDTFNANNIQLCFSGNAAPRELKNFNDKLLSRLEGGLVCDIAPPKEMALVELIKKKSGESGILLPDEVALELAQISTGSIRTIEGMINRLVAYSSLGNMTLDVNAVHMILKEFYPKGVYSPVSSLLEELKKNASEVLQDVSSKLDVREEYREKIYVWQMKGFNTSSLTMLLDGDVEILKHEYETFIQKVERLIDLQKQYGALDLRDKPDEAMKIESMLFSPDQVEEVEALIKQVTEILVEIDPSKSFDSLIIGACNEQVVEIYRKQVSEHLGDKYNPFIIFGAPGVGKTRLLEAIYLDIQEHGKKVYLCDCASMTHIFTRQSTESYDAVLFDNYHALFKTPKAVQDEVLQSLKQAIDKHVAVIICSERFTETIEWGPEQKQMFELGIEAELNSPDSATVIEYLEPRLTPIQYEQVMTQGVPTFASFPEIDQFITSVTIETAEVIPLETVMESEEAEVPDEKSDEIPVALGLPGEEKVEDESSKEPEAIISLGLPGEQTEQIPPVSSEEEKPVDLVTLGLPGEVETEPIAEEEVPGTESTPSEQPAASPVIKEPLKTIHEERFIVHDIPGELIEDNY